MNRPAPRSNPEWLTFGMFVRAARLGWRWSVRLGGWARISDGHRCSIVELRPAGAVPATDKGRNKSFRCWWDGERDGEEMIEASPVLRMIRRVKRPITMYLGDDGLPLRDARKSKGQP